MTTFKDMGLKAEILKALDEMGFENPTPIQEQAIPQVLDDKKDLVALAQTGTGKTAAFSLPILQNIHPESRYPQVLILCPTRELCLQIAREIESFAKHLPKIDVAAIYGGEAAYKQTKVLEKGPQIVVGTPGRVIDMMKRRKLRLEKLTWMVLDEADEMLNMGFKEDLDVILESTPDEKQTLLFSATMPREMEHIAKDYMHKPAKIQIKKEEQASSQVDHRYCVVHAKDRYLALRRVVDATPEMHGIVFCRTRRETQEVADKLLADGYPAEAIHGELTQDHRTYVMNRFRKGQVKLLVATDVAARGIDVEKLSHVIHYSMPENMETYVHRSGRTGRAGNTGISLSIVHMREKGRLRTMERRLRIDLAPFDIPSGDDIIKKQMEYLIHNVQYQEVDSKALAPFEETLSDAFEQWSKEDILQKFFSMHMKELVERYSNAPDINDKSPDRGGRDRGGRDRGGRDRGDRGGRRERSVKDSGDFVDLRLNIGKKDGFGIKDFFNLINKSKKQTTIDIGRIDIKDVYTVFGCERSGVTDLLKQLPGKKYRGRAIQVRPYK